MSAVIDYRSLADVRLERNTAADESTADKLRESLDYINCAKTRFTLDYFCFLVVYFIHLGRFFRSWEIPIDWGIGELLRPSVRKTIASGILHSTAIDGDRQEGLATIYTRSNNS